MTSGQHPAETRQWERFLFHCLHRHQSNCVRFFCLYHLCFSSRKQALSAVTRVVANSKEHPVLRGLALEQLADHWYSFRTGRLGRRASRLVLSALPNPDANIRFWACFAAAQMALVQARPILKLMLNDPEVGSMGWTVGYEAGEALKKLSGQDAWLNDPAPLEHGYPSPWQLGSNCQLLGEVTVGDGLQVKLR